MGIEDLVAGHDGYKVFRVGQVDDVVGPAGNHVDSFYLVAGDFEFNGFSGVDVALLDQGMALDDDEKLPFAVVPVLAFGDSGPGDIDGDLATILSVDQLSCIPENS